MKLHLGVGPPPVGLCDDLHPQPVAGGAPEGHEQRQGELPNARLGQDARNSCRSFSESMYEAGPR